MTPMWSPSVSVSESFHRGFCVRFVSEAGTIRTQNPAADPTGATR
jgi:hypothetical protein